jgi:predicted nucleic acid-binding Zn ribbon protein
MNSNDPSNPKNKKRKLTLGSEVLQSLFENGKSPLSEQFMRWKLWAKWEEVVGPTIAKNAEPVGFQRGVLYVWVRNSAWMQQMIFLKDQIRDTINSKFENNFVKYIKFTLDRREVPQDDQTGIREMIQRLAPPSESED